MNPITKTLFSLLVKDTLRELFTLMGPSAVYLYPIPEFAVMMPELISNWDKIADPSRCDDLVKHAPLNIIEYLVIRIQDLQFQNIIKAIPKYGRLDILILLDKNRLFNRRNVKMKRFASSATLHGYPEIARYMITQFGDNPLALECKVACDFVDYLTEEDYVAATIPTVYIAAKYGHINIIDRLADKNEFLKHNNGTEMAGHHDIKIIKEIIKRVPEFADFCANKSYIYAAKHGRMDTLEWLFRKGYRIEPDICTKIKYYSIEVALWIYYKLLDGDSSDAVDFLEQCLFQDRFDIYYTILSKYDDIDPNNLINGIAECGDKKDLEFLMEYSRKQINGYRLTINYETIKHAIGNSKCAYYMIVQLMDIEDCWDHDNTKALFQCVNDNRPYYYDLVCSLVELFEKKYKTNKHLTRKDAIKHAKYYGYNELVERLEGNNTN